jgi:hypothetical protein
MDTTDRIVISGVEAYDGEYEIDITLEPLTNRELHTIKQISGLRLGEFQDAVRANDNDFYVALTVVALERAGKPKPILVDLLWDSAGAIKFNPDGEGGPPEEGVQKTPEQSSAAGAKKDSSSTSSEPDSASPETTP